jgi:hypothetical protein
MEGRVVRPTPELKSIRETALANIESLPDHFKLLTPDEPYPIDWSEGMLQLRDDTIRSFGGDPNER